MKPQDKEKPVRNPGVDVGDEVYINHADGPCAGKVVAHGEHGATVDVDGKRHKVGWKHILGAKKRAVQHYNVIDQGEDGMIVEDAAGMRRYITVAPEAREDKMMVKAFGGNRLVLFAKAAKPDGPLKKDPDTKDEPKGEFGSHNVAAGDRLHFEAGDFKGSGEVVGDTGKTGAHVKDSSGRVHQIHWGEVKKHEKASSKEQS
jgi:hypothetical protein